MRLAGNSKSVLVGSSTKKPYREVNDLWAEISRLKGRKLVFYSETIRNPVDSARGDNIISVAVEDGENLKSFHGFERLLEIMLEHNIGREDYVKDRFNSRMLAMLIGLTGVVAEIPYIALQIVGIKFVMSSLAIPAISCIEVSAKQEPYDNSFRITCQAHLPASESVSSGS